MDRPIEVPANVTVEAKRRPWSVYGMLVLAILGFLDATYLTLQHFLNFAVPCSITDGCETVLASSYSVLAGVPVALLGALYYLAILIGLGISFETRSIKLLRFICLATILGLLTSLGLVYLQLFVIHAICIFCMASATTSTLLFIFGMVTLKKGT